MADTLTKIATGVKAGSKEVASNVMESVYSAGLFGTVLKSVVGQFQQPEADKQAEQKTTQSFRSVEQTLVSLEKYFTQISDNVYNIAATMGAQVSSMREIEQLLADEDQAARRAEEEAATENTDAIPASVKESESGVGETAGGPLAGIIKAFKGKGLTEIVSDFAASASRSILGFGARLLALMNPIGMATAIISAIGYGVFEYFTNDEFRSAVDEGISSLGDVARDAVSGLISFFPRLISGGMEFLAAVWETITKWAANAWAAVKDGVKSFFGLGEKKKLAAAPVATPTPVAPPAPSIATPTSTAPGAPTQPTTAASAVQSAYTAAMPSGGPAQTSAPAPVTSGAPYAGVAPGPAPQGATPAGNPNDLEKNVNKADSGIDLGGLVTAFKARIAGLAEDYLQATGQKLTITSGFRSPEKQKALYAKDPGHAAKPGSSPHEVGTAVDINSQDADKADQLGLLAKYQLFRPLKDRPTNPERWHVEPFERKGLASSGDGAAVPTSSGSAVDPGSGKPVAIPPSTGDNLAAASQTNEQLNETRAKKLSNIVVNNTRVENKSISIAASLPPSPCEPRAFSPLGA